MKGQRRFRRSTAEEIRALLDQTRTAPRAEQKTLRHLRQRLRNLGFYITDFDRSNRGFERRDFDELVRTGRIEVA